MPYNEPPMLLQVALGQLAVRRSDGTVSHILAATDADGTQALRGLRALWRHQPPPDPAQALPEGALQVTIGGSMPANFRPDVHFYSTELGQDIVAGQALSRVSVREAAALPDAVDDFLGMTDDGMVGLDVDDVRALLKDCRHRVGRYHPVAVDPVETLAERLGHFHGAACIMVSVRIPGLRIADPAGFEALSAAHAALGTTPSYLENVSPARDGSARIGLFVWNGPSASPI